MWNRVAISFLHCLLWFCDIFHLGIYLWDRSSIHVFIYDIYVGGISIFLSWILLGCTQSLWLVIPMTCLYLWTSASAQHRLLHRTPCFQDAPLLSHLFLEFSLSSFSHFTVNLYGDSHPTFWRCFCSLPSNRSNELILHKTVRTVSPGQLALTFLSCCHSAIGLMLLRQKLDSSNTPYLKCLGQQVFGIRFNCEILEQLRILNKLS